MIFVRKNTVIFFHRKSNVLDRTKIKWTQTNATKRPKRKQPKIVSTKKKHLVYDGSREGYVRRKIVVDKYLSFFVNDFHE